MLNPISLPTSYRTVPSTRRASTGGRSVIQAVLLRIGRTLGTWFDRAEQRRALLQLTDQHLTDIGIDRQTAGPEAVKHFWQA